MNDFTCNLTKPSHTITLHNGSKQVGLLDFNGPVMTFEGDADESAKVFFDFVAARFAMSIKSKWVGLTDDEVMRLADRAGFNIEFDEDGSAEDETLHWWDANGEHSDDVLFKLRDLIEAKLKAKNG